MAPRGETTTMPPHRDVDAAERPREEVALLTTMPELNRTLSSSFWQHAFNEIWTHQLRTVLPTVISFVIGMFPWMVSLRFVGGMEQSELAAAGLANTLYNVTGSSIAIGLSSALSTLTGQARGDLKFRKEQQQQQQDEPAHVESGEAVGLLTDPHICDNYGAAVATDRDSGIFSTLLDDASASCNVNEKNANVPLMPMVYLYQGVLVHLVFVIPIGLWWMHGVAPTLEHLGQAPQLAEMTSNYLAILAPGLWVYAVNWTLVAWLQSIDMADVPPIASGVGAVLHIPFNLLYINVLGWGYLGSAAATTTFNFVQALVTIGYLITVGRQRVFDNVYAATIGRTSLLSIKDLERACFNLKGIGTYLALALSGLVIISEWWASEIAIFLSGRLGNPSLGAMSIYQTINSFCFIWPMSWSVAGTMRVSNLLGAGQPDQARFAGSVSVVCGLLGSILLGCVLYGVRPHLLFPSLFAPGQTEVLKEASRTISILAIYVIGDGLQCAFNGVIKGCGRQAIATPVVVFAYWVVGLPLAVYLAFVRNRGLVDDSNPFSGVAGLVTGMCTGTWVHALLLAAVVVLTTDWGEEVLRAKQRLKDHH